MDNSFNAFVKFISDDPIMLGLCIAIIVLVILFIMVLILGRKKDNTIGDKLENTSELLKTEVNMNSLKSTQEFNLEEIQEPKVNDSLSNTNSVSTSNNSLPINEAREVPVTINKQPVRLDITTSCPKISSSNKSIQKNETLNTVLASNLNKDSEIQKSNNFDKGVDFSNEEPIKPVPLDEATISPIIESRSNPIDDKTNINMFTNNNAPKQQKTNNTQSIKDSKPSTTQIPFSSVFASAQKEEAQKEEKVDLNDFSRTAIIRHVPVMEGAKPITRLNQVIEQSKKDDDFDDIDLPKLNTAPKNDDFLGSLKGESFNINKG